MDASPNDRPTPPRGPGAPRAPTLGALAAGALVVGAALLRRRGDPGPRLAPRERAPREEAPRDDGRGDDRHSRMRPSKAPERPADRDPGCGRAATSPGEIPKSGWIDVVKRTVGAFSRDRLMAVAAGVTFYALLALFPAIAAFISLYGLVFSPEEVAGQVQALQGVLPSGAIEVVEGQIERVTEQGGGSLTLGFVGGLLVALWSANAGMKAIFDALNVVYDEGEERGFVALTAVTLLFTIGAILVIGALIASVTLMPAVFAAIPFGETVETLARWLRWPIALVLIAGLLALLYRYAPSRRRPQWRWVTWGALIGAVAWVVFSMLFSWYVANFGTYNATYGSLGAVVGFMVWIWLSTTIVLLAAELNAELERQTAEDTTPDPQRPLGRRGAAAADTVAPSP